MQHDYGFIEGVSGADKEELDVYVGPDPDAKEVYVVRQQDKADPSQYDEDKTFVGFSSADAAKAAYLAHRDDGDRCYGGMSAMSMEKFKEKIARRPANATSPIRLSTAMDGVTMHALTALAQRGARRRSSGIKRSAAGRRRAARYPDKLQDRATALAARALAPDLTGMTIQIDKATDFKDLRRKVITFYADKMSPDKLAELVYKTNVLGNIAGRYTSTSRPSRRPPMLADALVYAANPGLNGDVILYDDGANMKQTGPGLPATEGQVASSDEKHIIVNIFANQIVTVFHEILLVPGGTWRAVNGAGDATTASTLSDHDYYFRSGRNRIRLHTTTAPTTWEAGGRISCDRSAAV